MARVQSGCTDYDSSTTAAARNDDEWEPVCMRGQTPGHQTSESGEEKTLAHPEAARSDRRYGIQHHFREATAAAAAAAAGDDAAQQQQPTGRAMDGATTTHDEITGGRSTPSTREKEEIIDIATPPHHLWSAPQNRVDCDATSLCSDTGAHNNEATMPTSTDTASKEDATTEGIWIYIQVFLTMAITTVTSITWVWLTHPASGKGLKHFIGMVFPKVETARAG